MHFKHPELLYALFFLVIPVLVHLFRLRKFKTEKFTNVRFLKKAVLQTRKSSRIKKWLVLFTRLFLLVCVIIAFAQPYIPSASGEKKTKETVIYLDNSYSMQARGKKGVLLKRSVQDLLESLPAEGSFHLFTNDADFRNLTPAALREKIQELDFSTSQNSWKTVTLKAERYFSNTVETQKSFIAISDFQKQQIEDSLRPIPGVQNFLIQQQPEMVANINIDTAFVSSRNLDETIIEVKIKAIGNPQAEVSIGFHNEQDLLAKKTVAFDEQQEAITNFRVPTGPIENGRISIEDSKLLFDNQLYFSINETPPVEVVVIGDEDASFLKRIYKAPEFNLHVLAEKNIDYGLLSQANIVILNELQEIPFSLANSLQKLNAEGVFLVFIPSETAETESYNDFFRNLGLPLFGPLVKQEKMITEISFSHPLYESVFDREVENFQYPKVQSYYIPRLQARPVLRYENGQPFLFEKDEVFVFTAALNSQNSNFKSAPLIVPTFYNIANLSITRPQLYHVLGKQETLTLNTDLDKDEILKLASQESVFIPRQQNFQNKVALHFEDAPNTAGHYQVVKDSIPLHTLSFNIDRKESQLVYNDLSALENVKISQSVPDVFQEIKSTGEDTDLWKWFIIFALIFLLTEMLILKFLK